MDGNGTLNRVRVARRGRAKRGVLMTRGAWTVRSVSGKGCLLTLNSPILYSLTRLLHGR